MLTTRWHASPQRDAVPISDSTTGEVRIPLDLVDLDEVQGQVLLVLSRRETRDLLAFLLMQAREERQLVSVQS